MQIAGTDGATSALQFSIGNIFDGVSTLTVMMWLQIQGLLPTTAGMLSIGTSSVTGLQWQTNSATGSWFGVVGSGFVTSTANIFGSSPSGIFSSVFDGSRVGADRLKLYRNGVQDAAPETVALPATFPNTGASTSVAIGVLHGSTSFVATHVGNIKIWTAALTTDELNAEQYSLVPVRTTNLAFWAPLDDPTLTAEYIIPASTAHLGSPTIGTESTNQVYGSKVQYRSRSNRPGMANRDGFRRFKAFVPGYEKGL